MDHVTIAVNDRKFVADDPSCFEVRYGTQAVPAGCWVAWLARDGEAVGRCPAGATPAQRRRWDEIMAEIREGA